MSETKVSGSFLKRLATWILLILQLAVMFGILVGYKLSPESTLFKFGWWFLWVVVFPLILIFGYRKMIDGKAELDDKN